MGIAGLMVLLLALRGEPAPAGEGERWIAAGTAKVDITPEEPIRLSGYGNRVEPFESVVQKVWARALAIGEENPVVLVSVDTVAIPVPVCENAAAALAREYHLPRDRVAFAATHTHTAPHPSRTVLPTFFKEVFTEDEARAVDRYEQRMLEGILKAAREALANRQPAKLSWAEGSANFAGNRRVITDGKWTGFGLNPDGPVDHRLPLLCAKDASGNVVALLAGYACHCTTLGPKDNHVHGDWAGCAVEAMEREHPGAMGMIIIGCGADANPNPRGGGVEQARQHGETVAAEVERLLGGTLKPITVEPESVFTHASLPLRDVPDRAALEAMAQSEDSQEAQRARLHLAGLDDGKPVPRTVELPLQFWRFRDELGMLFLGGEVVSGYGLTLRREFPDRPVWITAYSNAVPCYIPTAQILKEGGYEAERSMVYYGQPAIFDPAVEETLLKVMRDLFPAEWR